jgi:glycosyltransferase involved in cell wall biosynthesis
MSQHQSSPAPTQLTLEAFSSGCEVVVLCWNTPADSDGNAQKIAAFLGAEPTFVSLTTAVLRDGAALRKLVPRCTCLIVDAATLAKAVDAMQSGVSGLRSLTSLAEHVFIYGFQPTDRHCAILRALSSGGLLGIQPLPDTHATFHVADGHREWCGQLSGLSLGAVDATRENCFVESSEERRHDVIIRAGDKPFFVRNDNGGSQLYFLACGELADLDDKVRREAGVLSWFSRLVPLMMFLRRALGNRVWHNDYPRACFIIDDPLLTNSYGFLDYRRLAEIMRQQRFSTCIAFIPWNHRRSSKEVAELFSSSHPMSSLCIHGCDHTGGEFATTDFESLHEKAQMALERMRTHQRLSGVPFDDIMVFPQGLFSPEAITALKASGYLAAVNTHLCPSTKTDTLAVRDLLEVAVTRFADFPLFGRRDPREVAEFALDLFMGKPALAVEHHGYFRDGYNALETFIARVNALEERLEWTNLATICSCACLTRTSEGGDVYVRFYTNRFWLKNDGTQTRRYILLRRQTPDGPSPSVTINGHGRDYNLEDGNLKIRLSLDAGQAAEIRVLSGGPGSADFSPPQTTIHNARVRIRRALSVFRDNYVDTNRVLSGIVSAARDLRSRRKALRGAGFQRPEMDRNTTSTLLENVSSPFRAIRRPERRTVLAELPRYVLVTPARNEAAYIEKTIESVVAQTILPLRWVIVSDGSTDGTDEVVRKFIARHDWIDLVSLPQRAGRNFAGKVAAFNAGQARLTGLKYDVIANLDGDVSFDEEYFAFLLGKLAENPALGLVGTPYRDPLNDPYDYRYVSAEHVTGPCQLFRRECFEAIGGYMPVKGGAIDRIADISARMKGWKTRIFTEKVYLHHRATGTSQQGVLISKFKDGAKDYSVGTSPIWELFRTAYQMTKRPLILGGLMTGAGYVWSLVRRVERPVSREMVKFCRREQTQRLKALVFGRTLRSRA